MNILQYLEETRPSPPLIPTDLVKRTRMREICEIIVSGIQPLQNVGFLKYVENERREAQHWIIRGFTGIPMIKIIVRICNKKRARNFFPEIF